MNYTTIKQSVQLKSLGLNPDSADLHYYCPSYLRKEKRVIKPCFGKITNENDLPCWSTEGLLNVIENIDLKFNNKTWKISIDCNIECVGGDLFKNCFDVVVRLLELRGLHIKNNCVRPRVCVACERYPCKYDIYQACFDGYMKGFTKGEEYALKNKNK